MLFGRGHPVDPRVAIVGVVATPAVGAGDPARVEERRELRIRDLVTLEPEVANVHPMHRPLVGRAVVAPHPERTRLDEHDAVGADGQPRGEREGDGQHKGQPDPHPGVCITCG
jgi:hypothetical protein